MVFRDYVDNLPGPNKKTVDKLAELTYSNPSTVYRWLTGTHNPPMVKKRVIAEFLGHPVEELFPPQNAGRPCSQK